MSFPRFSVPPEALVYEVGGKREFPAEFIKRVKREYGGDEAVADFKIARQKLYEGGMPFWEAHAHVALDYPPKGVVESPVVVDKVVCGSGEDGIEPVGGALDSQSLSSMLPSYFSWLDRNMGVPLRADDPPPSALCKWLWDAARSPANTSKVIDLVAKHLPPPKFMDERARMEDDGSTALELIGRIEEAVG